MKKAKRSELSRRDFIASSAKATAASAIAISGFPTIVPASVFGPTAPSNMINIGQIGIGRIARGHDLPSTMKYDDARVIALADYDGVRQDSGKKYIEEFSFGESTLDAGVAGYVSRLDLFFFFDLLR